MKKHFLTVLLFLSVSPGASTALAASAPTVAGWGDNSSGQLAVPLAAQSGVTAIAAGAYHTVALKNDGSVVAWGENTSGQTTVPIAVQDGVTAIAAGGFHTVALKSDGSVVAWGSNERGQTTVPTAAQSGVTAIAAGGYHTAALKEDGLVVAWGKNEFGETIVPVAAQSGVIAIAAGNDHTVALKNDGSVVAWGNNNYGASTVPFAAQSGVIAIAAGFWYTAALRNDGSVVAWGLNGDGQTTVPVAAESGVAAIAAGRYHILALKNDGTVVAWGENFRDQSTVPASLSAVAIAAGYRHSVAIVIPTQPGIITQPVSQSVYSGENASFTVEATGYPLSYQWRKDGVDLAGATSAAYNLHRPSTNEAGTYTVVVSNSAGSVTSAPAVLTIITTPHIVAQPFSRSVYLGQNANFTVVANGGSLSYQWRKDGLDIAGATNASYSLTVTSPDQAGSYTVLLSNSTGTVTSAPAALTVNAGSPRTLVAWNPDGRVTMSVDVQSVTTIAAGGEILAALEDNGSVRVWPLNVVGPVPVAAQSGVTAIAAGDSHIVALKDDGSVVAWGANDLGQTTVPVAAQSGVRAIAAGGRHTVASKNDGTVVAWGYNSYGQATVPPNLSGVTAVAAGNFHTLALKNDGSVVAWGGNSSGQTTVPVEAESGVIAIAAGNWHSVALKSDGMVVAWGANGEGQTTVPANLSGVTAIAAGGYHTVALKNDGTIVALGSMVPAGFSGGRAIAAGDYQIAALVIPTAPAITIQPVSQTVSLGQSASFTVAATGFPLSYQWHRNGVKLVGATNAAYAQLLLSTNQAGSYSVTVTNSAGSVTSAPALLTVKAGSGTWNKTSAPNGSWTSVASSADGTKLFAVSGVVLCRSSDAGVTWIPTNIPAVWVTCSPDGNEVCLAAQSQVYRSSDAGLTWTSTAVPAVYPNPFSGDGPWIDFGSSGDGRVFVAVMAGQIEFPRTLMLYSTNAGATVNRMESTSGSGNFAAVSADGSTMAFSRYDVIRLSRDLGATWLNQPAPRGGNQSGKLSGDGKSMVVAAWYRDPFNVTYGSVGILGGSGAISNFHNYEFPFQMKAGAISLDGTKAVAIAGSGPIYTTTDAGLNWTLNDAPFTNWSAAASSADGNKLVAVVNGGGIYTRQLQPEIQLRIRISGSNLVVSWSADAQWSSFVLQQSSDLAAANWTDVNTPPTDDGTNKSVNLSAPPIALFFRLKQ